MMNRTIEVVNRQIQAMGAGVFEIGIREKDSGKMMNRLWTAEQIAKSIHWPQNVNAQGSDNT